VDGSEGVRADGSGIKDGEMEALTHSLKKIWTEILGQTPRAWELSQFTRALFKTKLSLWRTLIATLMVTNGTTRY
jgi:hypothetical protein